MAISFVFYCSVGACPQHCVFAVYSNGVAKLVSHKESECEDGSLTCYSGLQAAPFDMIRIGPAAAQNSTTATTELLHSRKDQKYLTGLRICGKI